MWVKRSTFEALTERTRRYEEDMVEIRSLRQALAQAMNRVWERSIPDDYIRGWNAALLEVHNGARIPRPRGVTKARQHNVTHRG